MNQNMHLYVVIEIVHTSTCQWPLTFENESPQKTTQGAHTLWDRIVLFSDVLK